MLSGLSELLIDKHVPSLTSEVSDFLLPLLDILPQARQFESPVCSRVYSLDDRSTDYVELVLCRHLHLNKTVGSPVCSRVELLSVSKDNRLTISLILGLSIGIVCRDCDRERFELICRPFSYLE